jgi:hypothetical protein
MFSGKLAYIEDFLVALLLGGRGLISPILKADLLMLRVGEDSVTRYLITEELFQYQGLCVNEPHISCAFQVV